MIDTCLATEIATETVTVTGTKSAIGWITEAAIVMMATAIGREIEIGTGIVTVTVTVTGTGTETETETKIEIGTATGAIVHAIVTGTARKTTVGPPPDATAGREAVSVIGTGRETGVGTATAIGIGIETATIIAAGVTVVRLPGGIGTGIGIGIGIGIGTETETEIEIEIEREIEIEIGTEIVNVITVKPGTTAGRGAGVVARSYAQSNDSLNEQPRLPGVLQVSCRNTLK
ncbi:hypothetical protein VTH82DRAFT_5153 [Thermothelomyces myriococcoides]